MDYTVKRMIQRSKQLEHWSTPQWHPDLGDAKAELEHLRSFAMALLTAMPDARVELEVPEPGLMNLAVEAPDGASVEVYSVASNNAPGQRRYGLFLAPGTSEEREIYEDAVENAVHRISDDFGRNLHRNQVAELVSRRNALPKSSHVRAAVTEDVLNHLREKIECAQDLSDLDWCKWPMILGFVEETSDDVIADLDDDIDSVLAATPAQQRGVVPGFLKTGETDHSSRWYSGLFEIWAKATLLRHATAVQFDVDLPNGRNRDAVAVVGARQFSFEFTVITEDDESRAVWERFIDDKKAEPTKTLVRPGFYDPPNAKGPSQKYVAWRLYRKIFDKITNAVLDAAQSQCAAEEPNVLLVCFAGPGVESRLPGVNWAVEELFANHPKRSFTGSPVGAADVSLGTWADHMANDLIARGKLSAEWYSDHYHEIISAPRRLAAVMLFDGTTFSRARMNYNAHDVNAISHAEMAELEQVFSQPRRYWSQRSG